MTEVGTDVQCVEQVGRRCPDPGENLHGGGSDVPAVRYRDVGDATVHWEDFGLISPQGGLQVDRTITLERTVQSMGLSPTGGSDGRGRITGGGYLHIPPP